MAYKVKTKKIESGRYSLSYGKGSKKIMGIVAKTNLGWVATDIGNESFIQKKQVIAAWGEWAEREYLGTARDEPQRKHQPPPPAVKRKTPAQVVFGAELTFRAKNAKNSGFVAPSVHYTDREILVKVQEWHERYKDRINKVNQILASENIPGYNPFTFLRMMIDEHLERRSEQRDPCPPFPQRDDDPEGPKVRRFQDWCERNLNHLKPKREHVPRAPE